MAPAPFVVCLGEALIDRLGLPGGDPEVDVSVVDCLGGAPVNVACALARLGTSVAFAGQLGIDHIGTSFSNLFVERGLATDLIQHDAERPSRIVLVRRSIDGERQFRVFSEIKVLVSRIRHSACRVALADWLVIGTLPLASPKSSSALLSAVHQAQAQGTDCS